MGNMELNCLEFCHSESTCTILPSVKSGLAILHFLFLREVINELVVGAGKKMELRKRDCTAAQICSLSLQGT